MNIDDVGKDAHLTMYIIDHATGEQLFLFDMYHTDKNGVTHIYRHTRTKVKAIRGFMKDVLRS